MNRNFTIEMFIENRWSETRAELERISPRFVQSCQSYDSLTAHGFVLPDGLPDPEQRLTFPCYEMLESTWDVTQAVERLTTTLELLEHNTDRRLARYFYEVWVQSVYILCEKIGTLITYTCKLRSINQRTRKGFTRSLNSDVRGVIDQQRPAIVHGANRPGAGAKPITATVFTDNTWWEVGIFLGPQLIKNAIQESYLVGRSAQDYYAALKGLTVTVLDRIGSILEQVDQSIT